MTKLDWGGEIIIIIVSCLPDYLPFLAELDE